MEGAEEREVAKNVPQGRRTPSRRANRLSQLDKIVLNLLHIRATSIHLLKEVSPFRADPKRTVIG